MSLVTTCPQCQTAFVVKPEHLAAHRGDVRCGNCDHVFNALASLAVPTDPLSVPVDAEFGALSSGDSIVSIEEDGSVVLSPEPSSSSVDFSHAPDPPERLSTPDEAAQVLSSGEVGSESPDSSFPPVAEEEPAQSLDAAAVVDRTEIPVPDEATSSAAPVQGDVGLSASVSEASPADTSAEEVVGTDERAVALPSEATISHTGYLGTQPVGLRASTKPRRSRSWLWLLLSLILVIAAVFQALYFLRTELSIKLPHSKPLLVQMCQWLGCSIDLPRKIELISIDDSDLQEDTDHEGVVMLSATLINHAHFSQAYPLLELTLTDTDDRPVLRKSIAPKEYLPTSADSSAGMAAEGELHIRVTLKTNDIKAAGYRVFITY